jgi:hypothetical protein
MWKMPRLLKKLPHKSITACTIQLLLLHDLNMTSSQILAKEKKYHHLYPPSKIKPEKKISISPSNTIIPPPRITKYTVLHAPRAPPSDDVFQHILLSLFLYISYNFNENYYYYNKRANLTDAHRPSPSPPIKNKRSSHDKSIIYCMNN